MNQSGEILFVGREEELTHLMDFAKEAFAGNAGVAFVTGEAGIGKTYLVQEFFRRLRHEYEDVVIASGQCTLQSASYLPFQSILEDLLESHKQVKVSGQKFKQVTEVVVDTIWNVGPDLIGVFGIPIKALQTVIDKLGLRGKKSADKLEIPKDLDQIKIFGWYTKVMKDISLQFPLVLFLDDLHWADDSSLNLLLYLGRETENQRMLVIGTYRPHEVVPNSLLMQIKATLGRYGAREFALDVSPTKTEDVEKTRQFVHDYLMAKYGTNFSDQFERVLVDRTEGNALFLSEILKNLEEKGQITHKMGTTSQVASISLPKSDQVDATSKVVPIVSPWQLSTTIETLADLPEKVEYAISERINRLEETLREILDYASVEGDEFIAQVIAKVRELQERSLINDLTKKLMKTHQLILERGGKSLPNGSRIHEFSFKHNLIREYVYGQLSDTDKEFIHAEIGTCLEQLYEPNADEIAAQLALHFYRGHVLDKAVSYCLKAARDANARYGAAEALRFAKMGLEALESRIHVLSQQEYAETKMRFLLELARAEEFGGNPQEEKNHIQAGIDYLEENFPLLRYISEELNAMVYVQMGELLILRDFKKESAKEYLEKALSIHEKQGNKKNVAEILYQLGTVYSSVMTSKDEPPPKKKSIEAIKRSLSIAKELQDYNLQSRCLSLLTDKYVTQDLLYAEQCALRALKLSKVSGQSNQYAELKALMASVRVHQEYLHLKTALQQLCKALDISRKIGDILLEMSVLAGLGGISNSYINKKKEAQEFREKVLFLRERIGLGTAGSLTSLAGMFAIFGQWEKAEEYHHEASKLSHESSGYQAGWFGHLYMLQGDYAQAEEKLLKRLELHNKYRISDIVGYTRLAQNYLLLGKYEECKKKLEIVKSLLPEVTPYRQAWVLKEIADVYRLLGEHDTGKSVCQQALSWFFANAEDPEELVIVAEARLNMGKILVDMADYQEAITYLDKAKAAFEICGHYALGETLLYLGKAHLGLGGVIFQRQAQEYLKQALAEFRRLELRYKEQEAREVLNMFLS